MPLPTTPPVTSSRATGSRIAEREGDVRTLLRRRRVLGEADLQVEVRGTGHQGDGRADGAGTVEVVLELDDLAAGGRGAPPDARPGPRGCGSRGARAARWPRGGSTAWLNRPAAAYRSWITAPNAKAQASPTSSRPVRASTIEPRQARSRSTSTVNKPFEAWIGSGAGAAPRPGAPARRRRHEIQPHPADRRHVGHHDPQHPTGVAMVRVGRRRLVGREPWRRSARPAPRWSCRPGRGRRARTP